MWRKCFTLHYSDKDLKIEKKKKSSPHHSSQIGRASDGTGPVDCCSALTPCCLLEVTRRVFWRSSSSSDYWEGYLSAHTTSRRRSCLVPSRLPCPVRCWSNMCPRWRQTYLAAHMEAVTWISHLRPGMQIYIYFFF